MSKIAELNKLVEQMNALKSSIKTEDMTVEIDELVKQLDTVSSLFTTLSSYGIDLFSNEKVKTSVQVFQLPKVKPSRNKIDSVESLVTFLGTSEKSKSDIATHFNVSTAHVNGFLKKNEGTFTKRSEDPNNKLSKVLYSVKPTTKGTPKKK